MTTATLTINNNYLPLLRFLTPQGFAMSVALPQDEVLTTPGVDFERIRRVFDQFPTFSAETTMDCTNYSAAVTLKEKYEGLAGNYGKITMVVGSADRQLNVYVRAVQATAIPGRVVGGDANSSSEAYVDAIWAMAVIELP
jgi:hypothetical protein